MSKTLQVLASCAVAAGFLTAGSVPAQAAGSNALDRINFGDTGSDAYSESAHSFDSGFSSLPQSGTGALGQTYRAPVGVGSNGAVAGNDELSFTMTVSSTLQNYLTVRVWGGDKVPSWIWLQGTENALLTGTETSSTGGTSWGVFDSNNSGGPPPFPNRFYYDTIPIPISMTSGKASVTLVVYESDTNNTSFPARPVYSAYTHTDPHFVPDANDPTGIKPTQTGYLTPVALTTANGISILETNRQSIYTVNNNYYSSVTGRQVPANSSAPVETWGLDLGTNVTSWIQANPNATPDQWRNQISNRSAGEGYSNVSDELLSVLTATYLLVPFKDANGNTVSGLDYYHNATVLQNIVQCLDGSTYQQAENGGYDPNDWQGLTSTARVTGNYAGDGTGRQANGACGGLEGVDTAVLGWSIIKLLDDPSMPSGTNFKTYLGETGNFDLNGTQVLRAYAYEQMLYILVGLYTDFFHNGGTESQNMFMMSGAYASSVALEKLQALYPNSSYTYPESSALSYLKMVMGLSVDTLQGLNASGTGYTNYGLTSTGFGEAGGVLSCGYDGRYGSILPALGPQFAEFAEADPGIDSTTLSDVESMAANTISSYDQFISPLENDNGLTDLFTYAQEDFITYRDPYDPNADGYDFNVNSSYLASDPSMGINSPYALRSAYLETLYNAPAGAGRGAYLRNISAYEATVRSLFNVSPSSLTPLPGEVGQPNHAAVDVDAGVTSIYYNGERFYMNPNWRNPGASNPARSDLARIHDTLPAEDIAALVLMPYNAATVQSDGNLSAGAAESWVERYDDWLIAGNPTSSSVSVNVPAGKGLALDVISGNKYAMGAALTLNAGSSVALALPLVTSVQPVPNGTYFMTNLLSNLVLDDPGNSTTLGEQMVQYTFSGGTNQQWIFTYNGSGYYTIKCSSSGLYLTDPSGSASNGAALEQETADNSSDQLWQLIPSGAGYFFVNKAGGTEINDPGSSMSSGASLILYALDSGKNSVWQLQNVTAVTPQPLANGTYTVTCDGSGLVLDDPGFSTVSGEGIIQYTANGGTNQQWVFTYNGNGYYTIMCRSSGLYLTDPNGSTGNGTSLEQETADSKGDQLWSLSADGDGFIIINQTGGIAIDDPATSQTVGQYLDIYAPGGSPNQIWHIQ